MITMELVGAVTTCIVAILGGVWFMLQKAFRLGELNKALQDIDNRTCNAKCELHDNDISEIKTDLTAIKDDIVAIKSILIMKHKNASDVFSMKNSPRKLNANGERLFKDIKGEEFLRQNKDLLFSKIDQQEPKTAFDVENYASMVCYAITGDDIFNGMKNFVYNSPTYILKNDKGDDTKYDISLPDICFVLSIPLRDMYLAEHKDIPQE